MRETQETCVTKILDMHGKVALLSKEDILGYKGVIAQGSYQAN